MMTETRSWDDMRASTFDSREVIERIEYLQSEDINDENVAELAILRDIAEQSDGYIADWQYGETFIPQSEFIDYAQQLAEDIGAIDRDAQWPNTYIDWPAAAAALEADYSLFTFDGVEYLAR